MSRPENLEWIPSGGRWWRATRYEIAAGAIRPTADAKIETYDPWEIYRKTRAKGFEWTPPYAELTNLGVDLGVSAGDAERRVLEWCQQYGLLGILLHQVRMATLSPRWIELEGEVAILLPQQVQFIRSNTGWGRKRTIIRPAEIVHAPAARRGELVPREIAREPWARVGAIQQDLRSSEISNRSLAESFARFFPDVPADQAEDFAYPAPLSKAFWRTYSEPYAEFLDGLQCFAEALWLLDRHRHADEPHPDDPKRVAKGIALLDALLAPASATIVPTHDRRFRQEWVCGSLLCAFAMMALQDLAEGRHVRACRTCSRLFVSQHPLALYCSKQCRWKVQKRRQRSARKAAPTTRRPAARTAQRRKSR